MLSFEEFSQEEDLGVGEVPNSFYIAELPLESFHPFFFLRGGIPTVPRGYRHSTEGIPLLFTGDTLTLEGDLTSEGGWCLNTRGLFRGTSLIPKEAC